MALAFVDPGGGQRPPPASPAPSGGGVPIRGVALVAGSANWGALSGLCVDAMMRPRAIPVEYNRKRFANMNTLNSNTRVSSAGIQGVPPVIARPIPGQGPFAPLLQPGENVLWLERTLTPRVAEALKEVAAGPVFRQKSDLDVANLDLSKLLQPVSQPVARKFLLGDMTSILQDFGSALGRRHLVAKLDVVADDGCRKFHTDFITVRLVCSYSGPGTEWVKNRDVRRENLSRTDVGLDEANRSVLRSPSAVNHCGSGDILLLKGEAFDGNRGLGAVHRSPPIAKQSLRRLVFKVDTQRCC